MSSVMKTYGRINLSFVKGKGPWLYTENGKKYLDFASGIAVNTFGHSDIDLINSLNEQSRKLWHTSNLYLIQPQEELADLICKNSFGDSVFFCNSGAEAVEGLIKLVRRYQFKKGFGKKRKIIVFTNSFHGRTIGTLAAGDNAEHRTGFGVDTKLFKRVSIEESINIESLIQEDVAGILLEPIQGEGGINIPPENLLSDLRNICNDKDILLAFDEVQSGMGRTGKLFAHEWHGIFPDIMALAKGLGGGMPIGALVSNKKTSDVLSPGTHGSTFGGNFLSAVVSSTVLKKLLKEGFLENVIEIGNYLMKAIKDLSDDNSDVILGVRGKGLMIGIECNVKNTDLTKTLRENGLLSVPAGGNIVRFLPPLNIDRSHADKALEILKYSINSLKEKKIS